MKWLKVNNGPCTPEVEKLLSNNIIGTPGKSMVYQHQLVQQKLNHIPNPVFIELRLKNHLIGTCCLIERKLIWEKHVETAYYIRYFSFSPAWRSRGNSNSPQAKSDGPLKRDIRELLTGEPLGSKKPLFYAYVDPQNIRSRSIVESYGFQYKKSFHTLFISRLLPKKSVNIKSLDQEGQVKLKSWLADYYRHHFGYTDENIGYQNGCYGYFDNSGKLLAALQANKVYWYVDSVPGMNEILSALSAIPWFNKVFQKHFRFLSLEGLVCEPGNEDKISRIIEHCLAIHKLKTAVVCLDKGDSNYQYLKKKQGLAKRLFPKKEMGLFVKSEKSYTVDHLYVSAFDVM